jgi:hypothetical protein
MNADLLGFCNYLTMRRQIFARFEVFTVMKMQVVVFCVVRPCSVVVGYQRFGGPCCLHLQVEAFMAVM